MQVWNMLKYGAVLAGYWNQNRIFASIVGCEVAQVVEGNYIQH
jgi:hypothetical protein